jgi:hypothetical protein
MLGPVAQRAINNYTFGVSQKPESAMNGQQLGDFGESESVNRRDTSANPPAENSQLTKTDKVQFSAEAREIAKLESRDREVKTHEAAHAAVGGAFAGAPTLTYKRGPDGKSYAVGGEVSIDISKVPGEPEATIKKAQIIRAAALAPAQPSGQDLRVASRASSMEAEARAELANRQGKHLGEMISSGASETNESSPPVETSNSSRQSLSISA